MVTFGSLYFFTPHATPTILKELSHNKMLKPLPGITCGRYWALTTQSTGKSSLRQPQYGHLDETGHS